MGNCAERSTIPRSTSDRTARSTSTEIPFADSIIVVPRCPPPRVSRACGDGAPAKGGPSARRTRANFVGCHHGLRTGPEAAVASGDTYCRLCADPPPNASGVPAASVRPLPDGWISKQGRSIPWGRGRLYKSLYGLADSSMGRGRPSLLQPRYLQERQRLKTATVQRVCAIRRTETTAVFPVRHAICRCAGWHFRSTATSSRSRMDLA